MRLPLHAASGSLLTRGTTKRAVPANNRTEHSDASVERVRTPMCFLAERGSSLGSALANIAVSRRAWAERPFCISQRTTSGSAKGGLRGDTARSSQPSRDASDNPHSMQADHFSVGLRQFPESLGRRMQGHGVRNQTAPNWLAPSWSTRTHRVRRTTKKMTMMRRRLRSW